jgi:hypothetical protein
LIALPLAPISLLVLFLVEEPFLASAIVVCSTLALATAILALRSPALVRRDKAYATGALVLIALPYIFYIALAIFYVTSMMLYHLITGRQPA